MSRNVYLRPIGLLYGSAASSAVDAGMAGMLAGTQIAFQSVQLLSRSSNETNNIRSYQEVCASTDTEILKSLEQITQVRRSISGFDVSNPIIMGIVNTTPDSFSDGGDYIDPETAVAHGRRLIEEGADILDVGGESTRPGAQEVSVNEELIRTIPVVEALSGYGYCVSIDTRKSEVMSAALSQGAQIINDVSALQFDSASSQVVAKADCPVILMHAQGSPEKMQDNPEYSDVVLDIYDALSGLIVAAEEAGISRHQIIADPGIGFGKTFSHNLEIMNRLSVFHGLGVPLLAGVSRKRFLGELTNEIEAKKRLTASVAAALCAVNQGVQILRVHDVDETIKAIKVVKAIQSR